MLNEFIDSLQHIYTRIDSYDSKHILRETTFLGAFSYFLCPEIFKK